MSKIGEIFDRIDVRSIYSQHLTTFYHYEKKQFYNKSQIPSSDKILFIVIPLILTILLCLAGLRFNKDYVNIALTCLSIFAGLLFGLLTMVFALIQENQKVILTEIDPELIKKQKAKNDLTNHLFINIGFSIVLSVFALLCILTTQFYPIKIINFIDHWKYYPYIKFGYIYITNGISLFLLIEFFLALMMIVRRFTVLFLNQVAE